MLPKLPLHLGIQLVAALAVGGLATADDAVSPSPERVETGEHAAPAGDGSPDVDGASVTDAAPSDEVTDVPARPRRRWTDGPRRVPTPHGPSHDRALRLGLGRHETATELLHRPVRSEWRAAAGRRVPTALRWPVDVGALGRGFGYVRSDRPEVRHNGVDIATPRGMVIRAAADGIVAYSDNELDGYGNCVIVVHANGWVTLYAHADRTTVQPGWRVRRGERIAFVGSTGRSDGPHLHFELHVDGNAVNPMPYFEGQPWIEGREQLLALRRRGGGHTYGHLGDLEPDYHADVVAESRRARREDEPGRRGGRIPRDAPPDAEAVVAVQPELPVVPEVPALDANVTRWLTRGPSREERLALRDHRAESYENPIRLPTAPTYAEGRLHYDVPLATNLRASANGLVVFVGVALRGERTTVVVLHEDGLVSLYTAGMDPTVSAGTRVAVGDRLGIVRTTGGFDFELLRRGRPLDPTARFVTHEVTVGEAPAPRPEAVAEVARGQAVTPSRCRRATGSPSRDC